MQLVSFKIVLLFVNILMTEFRRGNDQFYFKLEIKMFYFSENNAFRFILLIDPSLILYYVLDSFINVGSITIWIVIL